MEVVDYDQKFKKKKEKKEKCGRMLRIHENSNGMCGACVGESYHLILDALCEQEGGGGVGGGGRGDEGFAMKASACVRVRVCVPVPMDAFQLKPIKRKTSNQVAFFKFC